MITAQINCFIFFNRLDVDALEKQGHGIPSCNQAWEENKGEKGRRRRNAALKDAGLEMGGLDSFFFKEHQFI